MASSPEVVGHEFMHNVISATTDLRYRDEPGAVNEALADLLGAALTASPLDRLNNDTAGEGSGRIVRNFVSPSLSPNPQPEIYSRYVLTSRDAGGVHTNSGILNKAHGLVIQGGSFRGFNVAANGVSAPVDLIRGANLLRLFAADSSMEEFAVAALGYCDLADAVGQAFGSDPITGLCGAFSRAYRATQLLPGSNDADFSLDALDPRVGPLAGTSDPRKGMYLEVTNRAVAGANLSNFNVLVSNEIGETIVAARTGLRPEGCALDSTSAFVEPGEGRCIQVGVAPDFVDGYLTGIRALTLTLNPLLPPFDTDTTNNFARIGFGSDYIPAFFRIRPALGGKIEISSGFTNRVGGFALLSAVHLARSTAHGPLAPLSDDAEDTLLSAGDPSRREKVDIPTTEIDPPDPNLPGSVEIIELPSARSIPGVHSGPGYQVWFDEAGGLPELEGRLQIYVLVDSRQIAEELDETNNFACLNCIAPGQAPSFPGVLVRLPEGTPVEELFPTEYQAAAAELPAAFPRLVLPQEVIVPRLRVAIDVGAPGLPGGAPPF